MAGVRVSRMCWMSSNSSTGAVHCIWSSISEKAAFNRSAFLISSAVTYGYSPYSRKLGTWCSRTNLMNASGFSFQSSGNPSRLVKTVVMPVATEQLHRVLGVLVEVGVEDALVLEVQARPDVEEHPAQVVQPQRRQSLRTRRDGLLDGFSVRADRLLAALLHLRDDREAVAGGRPREDGSVSPALLFEVALRRDGHRRWLRPVLISCRHVRPSVHRTR